jgi:Putative auto-transporter adhesin, head GIN domain
MKHFIFTTSLMLMSIFLFGQTTDKIVTVKQNLEPFNKVSTLSSVTVFIQEGPTQSVEVKGESEQIERVVLTVEKNKLNITLKKGESRSYKSNITVYITVPEITAINSAGSGDIHVKNFTSGTKLMLSINGSSDVMIDNSNFDDANFSINGSGDIKALDTKLRAASVAINGSGNVSVNCSEKLSVMIAGSGNVSYLGQPHVEKSIMGSGNVKHL